MSKDIASKKKFTDIFIQRPVLATVVSLVILLLGLRSIMALPLQQYPEMTNTEITITTSYPGASADVIQGFITYLISQSVASADGIDYLESQSVQGTSSITAHIILNFNPGDAMTNVSSKVQAVAGKLPKAAQQPVIVKQTGTQIGILYLAYTSDTMSSAQITDYLSKVVQPVLETLPQVSQALIVGSGSASMRIWLDPKRMAALNVTPKDVFDALSVNNYQSSAGSMKGQYIQLNMNAQTGTETPTEFDNMVIRKNDDGSLVRIGDVGKAELGEQTYDTNVKFNGKGTVFIMIQGVPGSNPLTIDNEVRKVMPALINNYPPGFHSTISYDSTIYIRDSIHEVLMTILEAALIVMVVIFFFLGSMRTVLVPIVTIPLSLIGVCSLMLAFNFSLNLLTLLAMVLAIGLVVDDAIVVVENIYRHIEEGKSPFDAAVVGAREIATPVISMSITLAAVYAPIAFTTGVTGALFTEFAITLACSVIISGVIALTLSPMMCSKILSAEIGNNRLVKIIDKTFEAFKRVYENALTHALNYRAVTVVFAIIVLLCCFFFVSTTPTELAPNEDQGFLVALSTSPQYANTTYTEHYTDQIANIYNNWFRHNDPAAFCSKLVPQLPARERAKLAVACKDPFLENYFIINGYSNGAADVTAGLSGIVFKDWGKRTTNQNEAQVMLQTAMNDVPGVQAAVATMPPLPGVGFGFPIQFVVTNVTSFKKLEAVNEVMSKLAMKSGLFMFTNTNVEYSRPQLDLKIDRNKAATLGISMQAIGDALSTSYGGNYINYFNFNNSSYEVIPQVYQKDRFNPEAINKIYVKTAKGTLIPLSSIVSSSISTQPNILYQYQLQNAIIFQAVMMPGHTMPEGLAWFKDTLTKYFPKGYGVGYEGQSRQYVTEGNALMYAFIFAIIIIFLVLAAQFESFRDPLVIMISVPMSICGALFFLNIGMATLNIYTEIGLVTLIGLITKHGILITEFANQIQAKEGASIREAIIKSAGMRLRPILMTTAAMVFGVLPLIFSSGPGAKSRYDIGLVIATGMLIGTCFTLFVVPTMYSLIAKKHTPLPEIE